VPFQQLDEHDGGLLGLDLGGVQHEFGLERGLIRVVDAGEAFELAGAGFFIEPLGVALLADLDWGIAKDFEEVAFAKGGAGGVAVAAIGANERGHGDDSGINKKLADLGDAADILLAIVGGKSEVLVEAVANVVAVEYVGEVAPLHQGMLEGVGHGALAGGRKAGEPKEDALLVQKFFPFRAADVSLVPGDVGCLDCGHNFPLKNRPSFLCRGASIGAGNNDHKLSERGRVPRSPKACMIR